MPIKFSDLAKTTKSATLDVGDGDTISFTFRHGMITPRLMHDILALDESHLKDASPDQVDGALNAVSQQVARLVASWDVMDADGVTMFPLDAERLAAEIPMAVQIQMLFTCIAEMTTQGTSQGEAKAPGGAVNGSLSRSASGATC